MSLILEDYVWHALYCAPQRELITGHDLYALGFPSIIPAEKKWRKKKTRLTQEDHVRVTYHPLMPRYVFTGFNKPIDWEKIRKDVPTVYGYMQFGLGPTRLRIEDVRWLRSIRDQYAGIKRPTVVEDVIRVGDTVRVIQGPFSGESVRVDKVVADRIHAIRNFLGAPRLFKIPVADLAPI